MRVKQTEPTQAARTDRRGIAILMVLICLLLTSMFAVSMVKCAFAQRQQTMREELRLQANWLAESAIDRAVARLTANENYNGELWKVSKAELGGNKDAAVSIEVSANNDEQQRTIKVVADFPVGTKQRARATRTLHTTR